MRLAEALILRADIQKRLEQLKTRIVGNAKVQEGDQPAENPSQLIADMESVAGALLDLIQRINKTNALTPFRDDLSLSDALAQRDVIMLKRGVYSDLAKAASVAQMRVSRSEVKFKSTVEVPGIQERVDALSKEYRELDSAIQEKNWTTDLMN